MNLVGENDKSKAVGKGWWLSNGWMLGVAVLPSVTIMVFVQLTWNQMMIKVANEAYQTAQSDIVDWLKQAVAWSVMTSAILALIRALLVLLAGATTQEGKAENRLVSWLKSRTGDELVRFLDLGAAAGLATAAFIALWYHI